MYNNDNRGHDARNYKHCIGVLNRTMLKDRTSVQCQYRKPEGHGVSGQLTPLRSTEAHDDARAGWDSNLSHLDGRCLCCSLVNRPLSYVFIFHIITSAVGWGPI